MISEERLSELLKTNSTIYTIYGGYVSEIELVFGSDRIEKNHLVELSVNKWGNTHTSYTFDMLFEDRLEAEEFLKYGNVTRTEKFPYVSWEEVCDGTNHHIVFTTPKHQKVEMIICDGYIDIICVYTAISEFSKPLTRENYHKALDICVKLFKGEEV